MTDDFNPTLAEAEAAIAALVPDERGFVEVAGWCLDAVMREYGRRGRVAAAAAEYIDECDNPAPDLLHRAQLRAALARAVRGEERG